MTRPDYATYILSGDWVNRCVRFFGDRPMCAKRDCRRRWKDGVGIHHRTYERLGQERIEDLVPLCHNCHKRVHARADEWVRDRGMTKALALETSTAYELSQHIPSEVWEIITATPEELATMHERDLAEHEARKADDLAPASTIGTGILKRVSA